MDNVFFSHASRGSSNQQSSTSHRVFVLRPSPKDEHVTAIYPAGWIPDSPPLYSVVTSQNSSPNILLFRGGPITQNSRAIGDAKFSLMSSKMALSLNGQSMRMVTSQMSGDLTLESPAGKFKWEVNHLKDGLVELFDGSLFKLARLKIGGLYRNAEETLEILCPCNDYMLDLVLLSGMVAKAQTETMEETALEVFRGIIGIQVGSSADSWEKASEYNKQYPTVSV